MIEIVSHEDTCKRIWNRFSDNSTLFDTWEFRNRWNKGRRFKKYFVIFREKGNIRACLPLSYNSSEKKYEWFGSDYMENNHIFADSPEAMKIIMDHAPSSIYLNSISQDTKKILDAAGIRIRIDPDPRNELSISSHTSVDTLLRTFSKKHRYNFLRDNRTIESRDPAVEVVTDNFGSALRRMSRMSKQRFGNSWDGENGSYIGFVRTSFKNILAPRAPYKCKFIIVRIGRDIAAIDLIIMYRNIYYLMSTAQNTQEYPGVGNFLLRWEFDDAINNKFEVIDCLQEDHGWKHRYFTQKDVYIVDKQDRHPSHHVRVNARV